MEMGHDTRKVTEVESERHPVGGPSDLFDRKNRLSPQFERINERAVAGEIFLLEIFEKTPSLAHNLEQAAARMMIFHVRLKMFLETRDAFSQKRNLNFRRSRVGITLFMGANDFRFLCCRDQVESLLNAQHRVLPLFFRRSRRTPLPRVVADQPILPELVFGTLADSLLDPSRGPSQSLSQRPAIRRRQLGRPMTIRPGTHWFLAVFRIAGV